MKSEEEIKQLAEEFTNGHYHYRGKDAFVHAYTQCQEYMLKILQEEIKRAFIHGQGNAQMMEAGLERDEVEDYTNSRMLRFTKNL